MDIENNIKNFLEDFLTYKNKNITPNKIENNKNTKEIIDINLDILENINLDITANINKEIINILENIGLKLDTNTKEIIKYLISNNIPINEDNISKFNKLLILLEENIKNNKENFIENSKNNKENFIENNKENFIENNKIFTNKNTSTFFNENTIKKIIFFLENNLPVTKNNINILNNMSQSKNELLNNIIDLSIEIENISDLNLKESIINILKNNNMYNSKKDITSNSNLIDNFKIEQFIKNNETLYKNIINNKNYIKNLLSYNKLDKKIFSQLIKYNNVITPQEFLIISDILFKNNNNLKSLFLSKFNINQKHYFFNKFNINFKENNLDINKTLNNLKNSIVNIKKLLLENNIENKSIFDSLAKTKNSLQFLNMIKNNTYIPLPIVINNNKLDVNFFIFKNKNKNKKNNSISALISLNTSFLNKIETFIQKNDNNIILQFRVENKNSIPIIKNNINILYDLLKSHNYFITSYSFLHIDAPFNILSKKPKINNNIETYKIDYKK